METRSKWPKVFPALTPEQQIISDDFMYHWHELLGARFRLIEKFNHCFVSERSPKDFITTLEIGAGLGEHMRYENLSIVQKKNYVALELREKMAKKIRENNPDAQVLVGDCQKSLPYADNHFDRIIAIHILEHLPDLPAAIREIYRACHKTRGQLAIVIPCEGGWAYSLARKISAQRIFERRYKQSYNWFISREHINLPAEILQELEPYFMLQEQRYFPTYIPVINFNLCIGLIFRPRAEVNDAKS
jgi:SAM-dependent methyltransferase